ncbi:hypothetical protein B4589_004570 [Halolamina sp. CBA1230]|uniref:hypothetical protein n=1 Tax=Halolamina sp. CBA1230 TaxID=1853690 RepID=UPI0009A1D350|nr:hypothetical protein [Halolamina sp. CBA1230]QKY19687.1 hypothetical protein B4589_004570 [Halolamina sp. CBA1230]
MGLHDVIQENRPLTVEQAEATDEVFDQVAPASDYRDQVVSEFLELDPVPLHAQTRDQKLPVEVDRARRAIRNVADSSNRTEANVEQRVKQVYDGPGEKDSEIARFAEDLKEIESQL